MPQRRSAASSAARGPGHRHVDSSSVWMLAVGRRPPTGATKVRSPAWTPIARCGRGRAPSSARRRSRRPSGSGRCRPDRRARRGPRRKTRQRVPERTPLHVHVDLGAVGVGLQRRVDVMPSGSGELDCCAGDRAAAAEGRRGAAPRATAAAVRRRSAKRRRRRRRRRCSRRARPRSPPRSGGPARAAAAAPALEARRVGEGQQPRHRLQRDELGAAAGQPSRCASSPARSSPRGAARARRRRAARASRGSSQSS